MRLIQATVKPARSTSKPAALGAQKPAHQSLAARSIPSTAYADLLGKPFADGARGPASYDCVGIALAVAARLGKQLPNYLSSETELHAQLGANGSTLAGCVQIARPEPGCLALFRMSSSEHHIGIMADEYRMVHSLKGIGCVIERVMSNLWQRKVMGFYRL